MAERIALWGRDIDDDSSPDLDNGFAGNGHCAPSTEPIPGIGGSYVDTDTCEIEAVSADEPRGHVEQEQESAYIEDDSEYSSVKPEYATDETANIDFYPADLEAESGQVGAGPGNPEETHETREFEETVRASSYVQPFIDRRPGSSADSLTFKSAPAPWYRTKRGVIVLVTFVAVAVLLAFIPLLLQGPSDEPTNMTPSTEPSPSGVQTTSTGVVPSLTSQPPLPPPPPPPPPPPEQDAPVYRPQYPSSGGGSQSQAPKPEIGVTRAPISVAPKPVTPPTSAEVGKHGDNSRW